MSKPIITAEVETVTPEMAKQYLETNVKNRRVVKSNVLYFVDALKEGHFLNTGQGIIFDNESQLRDGQHRLMAIVETSIPADMLVIRGVEKNVFKVLDSGVKRTVGQNLGMVGTKNANIVAATARAVIAYDKNHSFSRKADSFAVFDLAEKHPMMSELGTITNAASKETGLSPSMLSTIGFLASRNGSTERFAEFCAKIATGVGIQSGDPRLALRSLSMKRKQREQWTQEYTFSVIAQAWNAYIGCSPTKRIHAKRSDNNSYKRPEVILATDPLYQADPEVFFASPR